LVKGEEVYLLSFLVTFYVIILHHSNDNRCYIFNVELTWKMAAVFTDSHSH